MLPDKQIIPEYLGRIGAGRVQGKAGLPLLQHLHERQLLSIPFENLDIHWGVPIRLELPHILDKLIRRRRGGFCYEFNGAFHFLLQHFEGMCHYHQTSPHSHFTQGKNCTIATPEGRKTLSDGKFVATNKDGRASVAFSEEAMFLALLEEEFGIVR